MSRKVGISLVVAVVLVLTLALAAYAQAGTPGSGPQNGTGVCANFVDEDGDGVCDYAPQDGTGFQFGRMGRHAMLGQGARGPQMMGAGFVDSDGDGTCDNWVDANGDGVNDSAPRDGTGHQYGRMGR
jgi:hypothetical protein